MEGGMGFPFQPCTSSCTVTEKQHYNGRGHVRGRLKVSYYNGPWRTPDPLGTTPEWPPNLPSSPLATNEAITVGFTGPQRHAVFIRKDSLTQVDTTSD